MIFFILILYFAYWIHFYIYILQHFETNLKCLILSLSPSLCSFLCILVYAKDKKKKKKTNRYGDYRDRTRHKEKIRSFGSWDVYIDYFKINWGNTNEKTSKDVTSYPLFYTKIILNRNMYVHLNSIIFNTLTDRKNTWTLACLSKTTETASAFHLYSLIQCLIIWKNFPCNKAIKVSTLWF